MGFEPSRAKQSKLTYTTTCVIVNCKTDYKKHQHIVDFIREKFPGFGFPLKNQE